MNTIQFFIFAILFIAILYISYNVHKHNKIKSDRDALEAENTEFDYGHNVKHNSEEL